MWEIQDKLQLDASLDSYTDSTCFFLKEITSIFLAALTNSEALLEEIFWMKMGEIKKAVVKRCVQFRPNSENTNYFWPQVSHVTIYDSEWLKRGKSRYQSITLSITSSITLPSPLYIINSVSRTKLLYNTKISSRRDALLRDYIVESEVSHPAVLGKI